MEREAFEIAERIHVRGGDAAEAVEAVWRRFNDKSLAARAARLFYPASQIGRALLRLWPDPRFPAPYDYDCCW